MSSSQIKLILLTLLAVVFTLALTFATIELPRFLNFLLAAIIPDWSPSIDFELIAEFMNYVRPIGYASLAIIVALIIIGLKMNKGKLSSLGSILFFLPTFGYYAASMFFLTGIGMLRILWIPFWDLSTNLMKLGDIIYMPYMIIVYPFSLGQVDVRVPLAYLSVGIGLLIFCIGTVSWFYGSYEKKEIFDFWIYRYSRHPQYLGFIIWSYGVMLLASLSPFPFGGYYPSPSLPWLISALLILCISLAEEIKMMKIFGEKYSKYRYKAPFMFPLPKFISSLISAPIRMVLKRELPENGKEVVYTFIIYLVILIVFSLPFLLLNWPPGNGWFQWPFYFF